MPRAAATLLPLGAVGVLAVLPTLPAVLAPLLAGIPEPPPLPVLVAGQALQLLALTVVAVLVGAWAAPRVGFCSRLVDRDWIHLKHDVWASLAAGVLAGALIVGGDLLLSPLLGSEWARAEAEHPRTLLITAAGVLYGGLTEELMLRWGVMSALTYLIWIAFSRGTERPPKWSVHSAIVLAAVLFGVLHLGAVAATVSLTPLIIARTVVLNAIAGVFFGLLFAVRSLEAAMVAHAMAHVTITAVALLV